MKNIVNKLLSFAPIVSTGTFIMADSSQIFQVIAKRNSSQHSLLGWGAVLVGLLLWILFFKIKTPNERIAFWTAIVNFVVVGALFVTVIIYR
jgi:hypothetical protein